MTFESEIPELTKPVTHCDECFGLIDSATGYCKLCGLEASDFKDRRFNKTVLAGSIVAGEEESRQRKARKVKTQFGPKNTSSGYICNRCREMFQDVVRDDSIVEQNSLISGKEEPGTNLFTFRLKQEYDDHVRLIHGGKRHADLANRRMTDPNYFVYGKRKTGRLNKDTSANSK